MLGYQTDVLEGLLRSAAGLVLVGPCYEPPRLFDAEDLVGANLHCALDLLHESAVRPQGLDPKVSSAWPVGTHRCKRRCLTSGPFGVIDECRRTTLISWELLAPVGLWELLAPGGLLDVSCRPGVGADKGGDEDRPSRQADRGDERHSDDHGKGQADDDALVDW